MVILIDFLRLKRSDGPMYGNEKILPTGISQYRLQLASKPDFDLFFGIITFNVSNNAVK